MTFDEILTQVLELLQRQKRVSYRALKVRFNLDDEYLEALKEEIIDAQQLAVDENGRILVWTGIATPEASRAEVVTNRWPADPCTHCLHATAPGREDSHLPQCPGRRTQTGHGAVLRSADSTALAERIGPERMHTLLNRFFELALRGAPV